MFIEHVVFSLALAILVALVVDRQYAGWCILVITFSACVPDLDGIVSLLQSPPVLSDGFVPRMAFHARYFHSVFALAAYSGAAGLVLSRRYGLDLSMSALVAGTGFAAHLAQDALVYNPAFALFWPVSSGEIGIGLFAPYSRDFFLVAGTGVLGYGMVLLAAAAGVALVARRQEWEGRFRAGLARAGLPAFPFPGQGAAPPVPEPVPDPEPLTAAGE